MASSHLKRIVAPKTWPIVRKTTKFIARPKPNGQQMEHTMPVVLVMREMLGLVTSSAQARRILRTQSVMVNGRRVYDTDSTVGFMDVFAIGGVGYRVLINANNQLTLIPVRAGEDFIIQRIVGKTTLAGGKTQVNFESGRTLILAKDNYKVGDSLQLDHEGKVSAHYTLENGACVLLTGGSHIGTVGTVQSIEGNVVTIKVGEHTHETAKRYAYVIGKGKPAITVHA